jgi:homoserine kinase type II
MAVYTHITDSDLSAFLSLYDIGELTSFSGIAEGVENSNFLVRTTTGTYILTLYEKRVDPADLPFFLGLMGHLSASGMSCPTPIIGRDGAALKELNGRPAAMVTFLEGVWPRRIEPGHCRSLGGAMAGMHLASMDFDIQRVNALSVESWRPLLASCNLPSLEIYHALHNELNVELGRLETDWPTDLPIGVVHADLFPDNVFFLHQNVSGIIDFYFACTDFLAYDLAICLNAWCFENDGAFNVTKARLLISAYQKVRPLSASELEALPVLARGSAMRFLLTRLYDWLNQPEGAMVKPKDPMEYLKKLRFHQKVSSPSAYGLE